MSLRPFHAEVSFPGKCRRRHRAGACCRPVLQERKHRPTHPLAAPAPSNPRTSSQLGDITLVVWDQEVRGSQNDALEALNKAFQDKYPNIKIERKSTVVRRSGRPRSLLALSGNDVPDVVQVNNARADMGQFVKAGQLTDLYAATYGWE